MSRAVQHLRGNAIAYLALFVALGGTSYAALRIPAGSVGAKQLKNRSITPVKLNGKYFNGNVRAWAIVDPKGKLIAGAGKPVSQLGSVSPGAYVIRWGVQLGRTCATVANVDSVYSQPTESVPIPGNPSQSFTAGYVVVSRSGAFKGASGTQLITFNQSGQPTPLAFDVAVIC